MEAERARPNPDELLSRVQAEEQKQARGRLKIFLGYAAGVGKTYAMLEAAHQRQAEGVTLVVGAAETHGRLETGALLAGLEIIPSRRIEYHGVTLSEMDVDAVLARRPQLVLVDELAHTNAPGSRHPKRYLDVEELLAAGIDVYSTLNIQHLESLNDVVAQITGIVVRETVPDRILDEANEIELIDLPTDELIQRLREGKVYVPQQAVRAIEKFFRQGNLTALRELTMRRGAERVDEQMHAYMQTRSIRGPWPAAERLLVCLSPNPLGERLLRKARRLADEIGAEWTALYVETPAPLSPAQREQLAMTMRLAEELGAHVVSLPGDAIVSTVLEYARTHNITKIIAGKPLRSRWEELMRSSVVDQLVRRSGTIDVYVISGERVTAPVAVEGWRPHRPWDRYLQALLLVLVASGIAWLVHLFLTPTNLVMIYLLTTVVAAIYLGRGPAVVTSVLSVMVFDFFFVPPQLTFAVADTEYLLTFLGLLVVGLVISQLAALVREQVITARRREGAARALYELSRDLATSAGLEAILSAIVGHISQTFSRKVVILLSNPDASPRLRVFAQSPGLELDENEMAVATWSFEHGEPAGRGTDTLGAAQVRYLPLKTARGTVGILGIAPTEPGAVLTPEQRRLLEAFANLIATAVERAQLAEAARQAQLHEATEKLQTALLNSISHDLRTPLVSITGALSSLEEDGLSLDGPARQSLIETAREEAERLNRLVGNLLDMSRMEAGALHVHRQPSDVEDVIGAALEQLRPRLDRRAIEVEVPPNLPLVSIDLALMVQVMVNLVDNALKYSPASAPIEIRARRTDSEVQVQVADRGTGIPPEDLERVFDKFYRVHQPGLVAGTGLGLAISKGIVEAHGGRIWAENRPGGGTLVTLTLPLALAQPVKEQVP